MSEIAVSNIYSNDTKSSVNLSEVPGNISSINDAASIKNEKYPIYISEAPNVVSPINDIDGIKNENNYVATLENIYIKEEPLIAVDESDTKIEKETFTFPNQGLLHVKVSYIVGTLCTYC